MDQIIKEELSKKLDPAHVKTREQSNRTLSYIEGWHAIAEANRIFGFDGWTRETVELIENHPPTKNQKNNAVVSFRAKVRVTALGVGREGIGFGNGVAFNVSDAYELAIKEAETDAMKRALMTFGNPFGLALYDKTQANVAKEPQGIHVDLSADDVSDPADWFWKRLENLEKFVKESKTTPNVTLKNFKARVQKIENDPIMTRLSANEFQILDKTAKQLESLILPQAAE